MWRKTATTTATAAIAVCGLLLSPVMPTSIAHATTRYPNGITLAIETPFYESPDLTETPLGQLSPQPVYILGEQPDHSVNGPHWYQVATWIGPKWIRLTDQDFLGQVDLANTRIAILNEAPLYDQPMAGAQSGATLSPQTVYAGRRCGDYFEITTWLGEKWIRLNDDMVLDVKPGTSRVLTGVTPLFDRPSADAQAIGELSPQTVDAFEQVDGWYHVKTWLGNEWLNPDIFTPTDVTKADVPIELWQPTRLYAYPSFKAGVNGVVAPQTVQAFEQAGNWFHVHSEWLGDSWLYRVPNPDTYVPPVNPWVKESVEWRSRQLEIGAVGMLDSPLAVDTLTQGTGFDEKTERRTLSYESDLSIGVELIHTGDQHPITLTKPVAFGLQVFRLNGQKRELVWATDLPPLSGTLSSRGFMYETNAIVWKPLDADGRLLPPGNYELRLTPEQTTYTIDNKPYVQQWDQNSPAVKQIFELTEP